ncbi:MAG: rhomboid family protein [Verrucomicrobiota bacterium]|jgi:hypothetical protein
MLPLAQQHCLNHPAREAAAQCPQCRKFFCRECITEHDDRVICAVCLRKLSQSAGASRHPLRALGRAALGAGGLLTAVLFFYWAGQILLSIPAPYHDGTLWKSFWSSAP